ncbi:hypothetical protein [Modicisalibacter zincidurans]|uniref:Uncharacterized protein n=1 Tax=Modicisalibacter zincidurans TaxID=1178777 RepID=A0ABP9RD30_9GAMM
MANTRPAPNRKAQRAVKRLRDVIVGVDVERQPARGEVVTCGGDQCLAERRPSPTAHAMCDAGFANLPSEWCHYSYGDQMWAWYRDEPRALSGPTGPDTLEARWRRSLGH